MAAEFYIKNEEDDLDYDDNQLEIGSDLAILINQIRNIFSGEAGAIMGLAEGFIDLEQYIYEMGINERDLNTLVQTKIFTYASYASKFDISVSSKFARGTNRDIVAISIIINNNKQLTVVYK